MLQNTQSVTSAVQLTHAFSASGTPGAADCRASLTYSYRHGVQSRSMGRSIAWLQEFESILSSTCCDRTNNAAAAVQTAWNVHKTRGWRAVAHVDSPGSGVL